MPNVKVAVWHAGWVTRPLHARAAGHVANELPADVTALQAALFRVVALVNDKGGVGKTSISANLAGQMAAAGYRVLLVDLNRQANLSDDLGYRGRAGVDDAGLGLLSAIVTRRAVTPVSGVRPGLDVVPGGRELTGLTPLIGSRQDEGFAAHLALARCLAPVADDYELIVIDAPPEATVLEDLALCAARWVLIPTRSDAGGLAGMRLVAERFALARTVNPGLGLLGAVLFATGSAATAIHAEVREAVTRAFGGSDPMFATTVRYAERTARDARERGLLAHELEIAAAEQPAWWQSIRDGDTSPRIGRTAASVAADYRELAAELLQALARAEEGVAP